MCQPKNHSGNDTWRKVASPALNRHQLVHHHCLPLYHQAFSCKMLLAWRRANHRSVEIMQPEGTLTQTWLHYCIVYRDTWVVPEWLFQWDYTRTTTLRNMSVVRHYLSMHSKSSWRESVLAANAKKGRKCVQRHMFHPQATILHWKPGLKPLYVREVWICDAVATNLRGMSQTTGVTSVRWKESNATGEALLVHWRITSRDSVHPAN